MKRQHVSLMLGVACVLTSTTWAAPAVAQPQQEGLPSAAVAQADADALRHFQTAVEQYVALHQSLTNEVGSLKPNSTAKQIVTTSDNLARAIQRARPRARQGDFFSPQVRQLFEARVRAALSGFDTAALLDADDPDERSEIRVLRTYARFPAEGPLATMPPSVLQALPPLPDILEYRFVGNHLVLRDTHARLILDYIPDILAR